MQLTFWGGWLRRCLGARMRLSVLLLLIITPFAFGAVAWAEDAPGPDPAVGAPPPVGATLGIEAEQEPPAEAEPDANAPATPPDEESHFLGEYGRWVQHAQNMLLQMDLWGSSVTIPQGFGVVLFGYGTQRLTQRFDQNRKLQELIPIIHVPDPFKLYRGGFFDFDFAPRGSTHGYFVGAMYGLTDRVTLGVNLMWVVVHIKLDAIFTPGTCERLGIATRDEFFKLLLKLGHPPPNLQYDSDPADMGDTDVFAMWNYFRNNWFSGGVTGHLYVPTAHTAAPNNNIIFGLGPDIDTGNHAWGLGLNPVFDFRPPKPADIVTFSIGLEGAYYFQTKRKSPKFPKPDQDAWDYLEAQHVDLSFFPNLSDLDPYYYYTPPPWVAVSGGIGVGPFSVNYRHGWGFEGDYQSNSPGMKKMIDTIGLVGNGDDGKLTFAAGLPLTPLYIPGLVQFRFTYQTDGRNALVFRDIYQMGIGFFFPIAPPERYRLPPRGGHTEGGAQ